MNLVVDCRISTNLHSSCVKMIKLYVIEKPFTKNSKGLWGLNHIEIAYNSIVQNELFVC
jgi:hypothetical protein